MGTASLQAHHSSHRFEIDVPHWISGTVTSYLPFNPHVIFTMEVSQDDGQLVQWTVEGPRLAQFNQEDQARMRTNRLHGRVLEKADDNKWLWAPYGNLQHCVNPNQWDSIIHGSYPLPAKP